MFLRFEIAEPRFEQFLAGLIARTKKKRSWVFGGLAVTAPFKIRALIFANHNSNEVTAIGSTNTLQFRGQTITAYNTDAHGFLAPLLLERATGGARVNFSTASITIIGTGGAAMACLYASKSLAQFQSIRIIARNFVDAERLAQKFDLSYYGDFTQFRKTDILVNATPVGMLGYKCNGEPLVPYKILHNKVEKYVYDLVYGRSTQFQNLAKRAGCHVINGYEMFLAQAARQCAILTGLTNVPEAEICEVMKKYLVH